MKENKKRGNQVSPFWILLRLQIWLRRRPRYSRSRKPERFFLFADALSIVSLAWRPDCVTGGTRTTRIFKWPSSRWWRLSISLDKMISLSSSLLNPLLLVMQFYYRKSNWWLFPPPLKPEWQRHPISSKRKFIRQFQIHIFISLVIISQLDSQIGHVADTQPTPESFLFLHNKNCLANVNTFLSNPQSVSRL
jgi:hypothetical protein